MPRHPHPSHPLRGRAPSLSREREREVGEPLSRLREREGAAEPREGEGEGEPAPDRIPLALLVRLASALGISTMNALVKLAEARGATLAEVLFFRQAVSVPVLAALIAAGPGLASVRTRRIGAHAVRAASGTAGMLLLFAAVTLLPLAQATTLTFTTPIFATILGAVWLGEATGRHRWSAVAAGFAGVLIVAHPWSGRFAPLGTACGLGYAVATALVSIQLRQIGRTEAPMTTVFWFATLSTPVLAIGYLAFARSHPPLVWAALVGIGLAGSATQLALTGSLRLAPVSAVVPMDYSQLLWATLYGWALFGALPPATTWIGAPVIVASGLYIVWRERVRRAAPTPVATS